MLLVQLKWVYQTDSAFWLNVTVRKNKDEAAWALLNSSAGSHQSYQQKKSALRIQVRVAALLQNNENSSFISAPFSPWSECVVLTADQQRYQQFNPHNPAGLSNSHNKLMTSSQRPPLPLPLMERLSTRTDHSQNRIIDEILQSYTQQQQNKRKHHPTNNYSDVLNGTGDEHGRQDLLVSLPDSRISAV